jgi:hypothetical protein
MLDLPDGWNIVGTGDFNGDGITDILLRDASGNTTDWLGQAFNGFVDNSANFNINTGTSWHVAGTGDFNGSGTDDIIWQSDDGIVRDWLGLSNASFVGNVDKVNITTGTDWHVLGTGDFNGDGYTDVLWQHDNGTVRDWLGQADGSFVGNIDQVNILTGTDWHVRGTGDFNGDGRDDILWQNDNGTVRDWLGQADGSFVSNIDVVNFIPGAGWQIAGTGDFNGDGRSDILARNTDGSITDWLGQPDGGFIANDAIAMQPVTTDYQIAGIGDFNGDHRVDILFQTADGVLEEWVGSTTGAILSPTELEWQDAIADIGQFVDSATDLFASSPTGSGSGPEAPLTGYAAIFGPSYSNVNEGAFDTYPSGTTGHTFSLNSVNDTGFSGTVSSSRELLGSVTVIDPTTGAYLFTVDGVSIVGDWHSGAPPMFAPSNAIVITGTRTAPTGYFQFIPVANGINFHDGYGGGGSAARFLPATKNWGNAIEVYDPLTHQLIYGATGLLLQWPSDISMTDIFYSGLNAGVADAIFADPIFLFGQNQYWDFQRAGSPDGSINHPEFIDASTVAIGIYNAAAGVTLSTILSIENAYAAAHSSYAPGTVMDSVYTHLPERNVQNTQIGYQIAAHIRQAIGA